MRKYIRSILRANTDNNGAMAKAFDRMQRKKKDNHRDVNMCKGTHKRSTWKARITYGYGLKA